MPTDRELLQTWIREGHPESFAELVRRHLDMVHAIGLRITRSRSDADDVAQEAFWALARHGRSIREEVAAWLHTVARNAALRQARKRAREPGLLPDDLPADAAVQALGGRVDEALAALPDHLRAVLVLRFPRAARPGRDRGGARHRPIHRLAPAGAGLGAPA